MYLYCKYRNTSFARDDDDVDDGPHLTSAHRNSGRMLVFVLSIYQFRRQRRVRLDLMPGLSSRTQGLNQRRPALQRSMRRKRRTIRSHQHSQRFRDSYIRYGIQNVVYFTV